MKRSVPVMVLIASLILSGCGDPPDPRTDDVPTKGHVLILADEDLRDLVEAEKFMFESIYDKATLDIRYLPEAELLKAMLNDSVRCTIMTTQPGGEQETYFQERNVKAHVIPIATDGIAVVVNKNSTLEKLSVDDIRTMLFVDREHPPTWSMFTGAGPMRDLPVRPLFREAGSGVARTLLDSLGGSPFKYFRGEAKPTLAAVIGFVADGEDAIGFIPFSSISDLDDPGMKHLRDRVKLLAISTSDTTRAMLPSQGTLADGSYPLRRPVYMVLAEGKSGLGTGFVSFVANHKGQRIILKHGIAPNKVPPREIEVVAQ